MGSASPRMIAAEASTLRAASSCCQASVNPALRASCAKKARCARPEVPIALAEWLQGVDLAQVIGQPPDERIAAQATQAVFVVQLAEDDGRGGIYVLREAEHGALGHGHRPDLPGPPI